MLETEGEVISCSFYLDPLTYCMPAFLRLGADTGWTILQLTGRSLSIEI